MTDLSSGHPQELESLDERIEALVQELDLATRWQCPCLLFAVYSSECVRADVAALLENQLIDLGQEVFHVRVESARDDFFQLLEESESSEYLIFFVEGLRWGHPDEQDIYRSLDQRREYFKESRIRAVFWLTENEFVELAHHAPEFWGLRHRVVEFVESPTPDQVMQQALEAAWQGTGEYAGRHEDMDEKILLGESLLTDIPVRGEVNSLRANLLLTLGLLNWRKGDFGKADEQLREALRIAEKIQDNWIEAECFNGIALVKTSMERIDEAIFAYKQAIRLAPEQVFAWNNLGNLCTKIGRKDEAIVAFMKAIECNPQDSIAWNGLGSVYHGIGYFDDAIAAFRRSIRSMPSFPQAWTGLGEAYAGVGRFDDAIKAYQKAAQLNDRFITPWLRLAELYGQQDRYRDAARAYQKALRLDPRNADAWNELGLVFVKSSAYEDAEAAFSKAIDIDGSDGHAFRNLAMVCTLQEKHSKSIPLYKRSIELLRDDHEKMDTWNRLGNAHRQMNDYDNAIAAYQVADKLGSPATSFATTGRSAAQTALTQARETEAQMVVTPLPEPVIASDTQEQADGSLQPHTAVGEAPVPTPEAENSDAPYWIFQRLPQSGIPSEPGPEDHEASPGVLTLHETGGTAMSTSSSLKSTKPGKEGLSASSDQSSQTDSAGNGHADAFAWNEEGNVQFKRGAYEEAINAYNKAIQLDPRFGWPYSNLALSYLAQGKPAEAILLYQKSIAVLTSDAERAVSWNGLGNAYRLVHDYSSAMSAYQKAAGLDPENAGMRDGAGAQQVGPSPDNAKVWNALGESLVKSGAYDQAAIAFKKAISSDPNFGWPYSNLARALAFQGKHTQAIPLYRKSIELLSDKNDKAISWNRLGNTYRKLNDYDNAIKAFQEAVALADDGMDLVTRTRFSLLSNCCAE